MPLYSTSTTLFLNSGVASPLLPYQTGASLDSLAGTYVAYMRTRSFAGLVAQELDTPLSENEILGTLSSELVPETQFFIIRATHPDPRQAQDLANTTAEVLIAENIARQQAQREQLEAQRDPALALERQRLVELQKSLLEEQQYTTDRMANLEAEIAELQSRPPSQETDLKIMNQRGQLVNHQSFRLGLFGSLAQTQAALASAGDGPADVGLDTAVVVDPAPLPLAPEPRRLEQYVLLAVVAAAGLGAALAFLLEYLDWTIKTPEELNAVYGQSTLGVIGVLKNGGRGRADPEMLVTLAQSRSPIAEAFRALQTNVRFSDPDNPLRSLLVTSAGPLEGKTLTSANLAIVLAQSGRRVILVDADLRRPRQHRLFDVAREPGFTNLVLRQNRDGQGRGDPRREERGESEDWIETTLQATGVENLRVLACGPLPRNPVKLLTSDRCAEVMAQLEENADLVLYDSPPAATVTDAAVLAARVDAVLHVVKAGGPRRDVVLRVRDILRTVGGHVLGPVLNQVSHSDLGYYSYYYYGYYHSDGDEAEEEGGAASRPGQKHRRADGRRRRVARDRERGEATGMKEGTR